MSATASNPLPEADTLACVAIEPNGQAAVNKGHVECARLRMGPIEISVCKRCGVLYASKPPPEPLIAVAPAGAMRQLPAAQGAA